MRTYIQQPGQVGVPGAPGNVGYLAQMPPALNPAAFRGARRQENIQRKLTDPRTPANEREAGKGFLGPQLPPMARLDGSMNMNMGQMNDAYLQEQERQRLLQEQEAQSELNASMFRGGQYGQADQYSAASAGFQNKTIS